MIYQRLTYGTMPKRPAFHACYVHEVGPRGAPYNFELKGRDAETARKYGIAWYGPTNEDGLWEVIDILVTGFQSDNDEDAGDLASSFLQSIGIEWI